MLTALGTVSLAIGFIGIFVPLLPATPFLVLAAALYAHSSERFYRWLVDTRWLGGYISNYRERRGMDFGHKLVTLGMLWLTIGLSAAFATDRMLVRAILGGIAVAVTVHVLLLRTFRPARPRG